jgi:uncharacterized phage protein (TIGR02220 family)
MDENWMALLIARRGLAMSVIRIKKAHKKPYVILDTTALNDPRLSFRAKGLHTYLMAKPDDWQVYIEQLEKESPTEGRDAIRAAMNELADAGYLKRDRIRGEKGRMQGWDTTVYETPALAVEDDCECTAPAEHIGLSESAQPKSAQPKSAQPKSAQPKSAQPKSANPQLLSIDLNSGLNLQRIDVTNPPNPQMDGDALEASSSVLSVPSETPHVQVDTGYPLFEHSFTSTEQPVSVMAQQVVDHLNARTGKQFVPSALIRERLQGGATVDQHCLVIDWLWDVRRARDAAWVDQYLDTSTPFKGENFNRFLGHALKWHKDGRPPPDTASTKDTRISEKGRYNLQSTKTFVEMLNETQRGDSLRADD